MHTFADVAKQRRNHQDHLVKKSIEERDPSLINLPLPLPDVPILSPIVSPLIGGSNQNPTTKHTTQTTNPPQTQTTKPTEPTSPHTTPTDPPADPPTSSTTPGGSPSSPSDPTGSDTASSGQQDPTHTRDVNAGSNPSSFPDQANINPNGSDAHTFVTTLYSGSIPVATQTVVGSSQGTDAPNAPGGDGNNNGNANGQGSGSTKSPKVSAGVIAAVVIVAAIAFLAVFIIARRRRYIAKRSERRTLWWSQAKKERWSGSESLEATAGTQSARSSFATTFDHGSQFHSSESVAPPLPPMAELRDDHGSGLLLHSQPTSPIQVPPTPALISFDVPVETNDRRNSTFSTRSNGSDEGQYLVAPPKSTQPNPSPISVRPFSPSESYSFPRPPSMATPAMTPAAKEPADPFMDPVQNVTEPWTPLFFGKEVIRRPFAPTLHDEVGVSVGETVRVSKVFDDGWALIEKLPLDENSSDKGKQKQVMGLIPVDCLRDAGQDLSTFLASTRLSSYSAIPEANMGTAV